MAEEKAKLTIIQEDDGRISIQGNEENVKKASILIAEFFLKEDEITEPQIETIVDIAENLYDYGKGSPEHLKAAKKFLEAVDKYSNPRAMYELAMQEENSLIAEASLLRAAIRTATAGAYSPAIGILQEEYEAQVAYWRKRKAEVEGKTFDSNAPTIEEILDSDRLRFFNIYKRAFNGDLEAIKMCLEFCEEELNYWNNY